MADETDPPSAMKRYRPARAEHRARSHESAHEAAEHDGPAPPDHPLIPRGHAPLLSNNAELAELIGHLRSVGTFAYDSEFIGELTYIPKLCVVQVASRERVVLVDPLADIDLTPFWELICDPAVEKIVHAGQQDLEPVFRHLGRCPENVFDTQVAAAFIGMTYPASLSKIVRELTGAWLGKGLTFSHWDQRPLSGMQLRYAADDVRYLPAVRAKMGERLETLGHTAWAKEECDGLCDIALYRFDPETQYLRVRGGTSLAPAGLAILKELVRWRDAASRNHDVPPRAFLKDEILVDMCKNPVKSVDKLARVKGLPRPIELTHGGEIVEAILRGMAAPVAQQSSRRPVEETPSEKFRADSLWTLAECLCMGRGIDANLVASRQEIVQLHRHLTAGDPTDDVRLLSGWRRKAVGGLLMQVARGERKVELGWGENGMRARGV